MQLDFHFSLFLMELGLLLEPRIAICRKKCLWIMYGTLDQYTLLILMLAEMQKEK